MAKTSAVIDTKLALSNLRRGLPLCLSMAISESLQMMDCGKIELARRNLEEALLHANAVSPEVVEFVGVSAVRDGGKGF